MFYLSYYLHWSHGEILGMETGERREFVRMLNEEIERQNRALDEAPRGR